MTFKLEDEFNYNVNRIKWDNLKLEGQNDALTHMYFFMLSLSSCNNLREFSKKKHEKIYGYNHNEFIKNMTLNLVDILNRSQRHYNALTTFAKIIKYKRQPSIKDDLLLNPITNQIRHMKIIHINTVYLFTIKDLINIINSSLSNCSTFYADPKEIKNPYNNMTFDHHILYNIYYAIKASDYTFPILFHQYYLCNFNLRNYAIENEYLIRDININNILYNTNEKCLFKSMKKMLEKYLKNIRISDDVDKQEFIKIIRPYYYLYLIKMFHVHGVEKTYKSYEMFIKKIHELYEYNCRFGRVMLKRQPISRKFKQVQDLDHPKFTMNDARNYEMKVNENIQEEDDTETQEEDDTETQEEDDTETQEEEDTESQEEDDTETQEEDDTETQEDMDIDEDDL
jgi:hypothetical protein